MEWVKLAAAPAYYLDGSLLRAGEAAEVLFCRGLAHCGAVESAGRIDKTVLPMLVQTKAAARANALVREGLWIDMGDHYVIRSWDKWQQEHDAAADRRRRDRERKREARRSAERPRNVRGRGAESPALDVEGDVEGDRAFPDLGEEVEVELDPALLQLQDSDEEAKIRETLRLVVADWGMDVPAELQDSA